MKTACTIFLLFIGWKALAQPANNLCSGATSTTADGTCYNGTLVGAADNLTGEIGCATQGGPNNHADVWYSFTASTTTVEFSIGGGTLGTIEMLLLTGTCPGPFTLVNSSCSTAPLTGVFANLVPGQTYFYVISAPNQTGTFTTCFNSITAPPTAGQDCTTAAPICSNSSFGGNSEGYSQQELPNNGTVDGCLTVEHQSSWYYFQIAVGGTLEMTIDPEANIDYDFAIWGPFTSYSCPITVNPVRCSYSALYVNTGMGNGASDTTEPPSGDAWVAPMNVLAGEFYVMLIDNFTSNSTAFNLQWGGTAILSCSILPVEMISFGAQRTAQGNRLDWLTASEAGNDHFEVERSDDGMYFYTCGRVEGAGYSSSIQSYSWLDPQPFASGVCYYRLLQVDDNGMAHPSEVVAVHRGDQALVRTRYFDASGREYAQLPQHPGFIIVREEYADGSAEITRLVSRRP